MSRAWLIIAGTGGAGAGVRYDLKPGLTMLGGARGDVPLPESGSDSVHLWSEPPKLIFVGAGTPPLVNGQAALEMALHSGDRIEWRGLIATFGYEDGQARLEELPAARPIPAVAARAPEVAVELAPSSSAPMPWRWLKAGIVAEMSLADRAVIKRWQESVARGEFDIDAVSRDLLAAAPGLADDDPRLRERATRLTRDLLMSSVTRSPMRQVRKVARNSLAFALVQLMILAIFSGLVLSTMLLAHTRFGHSIDAFLDSIVNFF